jgi:YHS domain-containing protein
MKKRDPVCGMSVDDAAAKHGTDYQGEAYFFCGSFCLDEFRRDPSKYLAPTYRPSKLRLFAKFVRIACGPSPPSGPRDRKRAGQSRLPRTPEVITITTTLIPTRAADAGLLSVYSSCAKSPHKMGMLQRNACPLRALLPRIASGHRIARTRARPGSTGETRPGDL